MLNTRRMQRASWTLLVLACPFKAFAHTPSPGLLGFWQGVFFPYISVVPAVCCLGLGLVIGRRHTPALIQRALLVFFGALIAFSVLCSFVPLFPSAYIVGCAFVLTGGVMIRPLDVAPSVELVAIGLCAAMVGMLLGAELVTERFALPFYLGSIVGTLVGLSAALNLWLAFFREWFVIGIRILGSWLMAIGLMLLASALST